MNKIKADSLVVVTKPALLSSGMVGKVLSINEKYAFVQLYEGSPPTRYLLSNLRVDTPESFYMVAGLVDQDRYFVENITHRHLKKHQSPYVKFATKEAAIEWGKMFYNDHFVILRTEYYNNKDGEILNM